MLRLVFFAEGGVLKGKPMETMGASQLRGCAGQAISSFSVKFEAALPFSIGLRFFGSFIEIKMPLEMICMVYNNKELSCKESIELSS